MMLIKAELQHHVDFTSNVKTLVKTQIRGAMSTTAVVKAFNNSIARNGGEGQQVPRALDARVDVFLNA
eukprot:12363075-Karenia_brevis.AAC.1